MTIDAFILTGITLLEHYQKIYKNNPVEYHRMISGEDADGNLKPAIENIFDYRGKNILDIGSGTGRIPLLLSPDGKNVISIDISMPMLKEQCKNRDSYSGRWEIIQGDMRRIPIKDNWADITICGWAICHYRNWHKISWKEEISKILYEMKAVTAKGGGLIIIETMSTGDLEPKPPSNELAEYYEWLENRWSFQRMIIQTDYEFDDIENAIKNTEFFFGKELSKRIRNNRWCRVPEWTGVWYRRN